MITVYIKEIRSFLSSLIAYVAILVFLTAIGLFMWIFPETNIMDIGYANLDPLFFIGPWVLIFLISAITMRTFAEEKKAGTLETLTTAPISDLAIILAKFLAGLTLVLFALLPTLVYYISLKNIALPAGNVDSGAILGSYIGLLLVGSVFVSIGMFSSALADNQIVAFILSTFFCFFFYVAFDYLAGMRLLGQFDLVVEWLGISFHYESISRGVLDSRDAIYFMSMNVLFLGLTHLVFGSRKW